MLFSFSYTDFSLSIILKIKLFLFTLFWNSLLQWTRGLNVIDFSFLWQAGLPFSPKISVPWKFNWPGPTPMLYQSSESWVQYEEFLSEYFRTSLSVLVRNSSRFLSSAVPQLQALFQQGLDEQGGWCLSPMLSNYSYLHLFFGSPLNFLPMTSEEFSTYYLTIYRNYLN